MSHLHVIPTNLERRFFSKRIEVRCGSDNTKTIRGYASVFNSPSSPGLGFIERVKPGAFSRALREKQDVRCLINHDPSLLLGRSTNGTLRMQEDDTGLFFENDLPDTSYARDLFSLIQRGDLNQCSFSFLAKKQKWGQERNADGDMVATRDLEDVDLLDLSAVTVPVYSDTRVGVAGDRDIFDEVFKPWAAGEVPDAPDFKVSDSEDNSSFDPFSEDDEEDDPEDERKRSVYVEGGGRVPARIAAMFPGGMRHQGAELRSAFLRTVWSKELRHDLAQQSRRSRLHRALSS